MKRVLILALAGAGGLLLGVPDADAQDCNRNARRVRSRSTITHGYRSYDRGFQVQFETPRFSMSYRHAPRYYGSRHCGGCRTVNERVWVNQPRYQQVFAGYDFCGRPVYRRACVSRGHWTTRTRYVCY